MFVARRFLRESPVEHEMAAVATYALTPLSGEGGLVRFDSFSSESEMRARGGDAYERVLEVSGAWSEPPTHAVFAEWSVADPAHYAAFEQSRRLLFDVRRQHLATFAVDWLLRSLDVKGRYLVLGLYGDEEGAARLCREHPAVQSFTRDHPAAGYSATDVTGLRVFRVRSLP